MVKFLLENHANINARDVTGCTPIYYAIRNANVELTKLFLFYRALPWCFTSIRLKFRTLYENKEILRLVKLATKVFVILRLLKLIDSYNFEIAY